MVKGTAKTENLNAQAKNSGDDTVSEASLENVEQVIEEVIETLNIFEMVRAGKIDEDDLDDEQEIEFEKLRDEHKTKIKKAKAEKQFLCEFQILTEKVKEKYALSPPQVTKKGKYTKSENELLQVIDYITEKYNMVSGMVIESETQEWYGARKKAISEKQMSYKPMIKTVKGKKVSSGNKNPQVITKKGKDWTFSHQTQEAEIGIYNKSRCGRRISSKNPNLKENNTQCSRDPDSKNGFYCKKCMTEFYNRENEIWANGSFLLYGEGCMGNKYKKSGEADDKHFGGNYGKNHGLGQGPTNDMRPAEIRGLVPPNLQ